MRLNSAALITGLYFAGVYVCGCSGYTNVDGTSRHGVKITKVKPLDPWQPHEFYFHLADSDSYDVVIDGRKIFSNRVDPNVTPSLSTHGFGVGKHRIEVLSYNKNGYIEKGTLEFNESQGF